MLQATIKRAHNPDLVDVSMAPNSNKIFHIYSDGEITEQKGSYAYGMRSERTLDFPVINSNYLHTLFPILKTDMFGVKVGYAIVTYNDAIQIRKLIATL